MVDRRHARTALWAAAFLTLAGLAAWSILGSLVGDDGGDAPGRPVGAAPPCPYGYVDQPARGGGLARAIRGTADGARLLDALGETEVRYCFGEAEHGYVTEGRLLLLPREASSPVLAARVAHLLDHVVNGMPFPDPVPPGADCDALIATAVEREARAYLIEVRVRRALGETDPRYEFEPAVLAAPEDRRAGVVADYLRAHPDGAPNLDGLVSGYRARCARAPSKGSPRVRYRPE